MSKIKLMVAALSLAALLSTEIGCATPRVGREEIQTYRPGAKYGSQKNVANYILDLIRDEFDYANIVPICERRGSKDDCIKVQYVVRGYEEIDDIVRPVWGLNINRMCDAYLAGTPLLEYFLGDDTYIENADGTVVHARMSKDTAEKLTETVELYAPNNAKECAEWARMIYETSDPGGPIDRPK